MRKGIGCLSTSNPVKEDEGWAEKLNPDDISEIRRYLSPDLQLFGKISGVDIKKWDVK